jgi:hypothetical protein
MKFSLKFSTLFLILSLVILENCFAQLSCSNPNDRAERIDLEKRYQNIFKEKVAPSKEFQEILCRNFDLLDNKIIYAFDYQKNCTPNQINLLLEHFLKENRACNPPSYVNDIDEEFFNACHSLFQIELEKELSIQRKNEIHTLFNYFKDYILSEFYRISKEHLPLKAIDELNEVDIDITSQLYRNASGIDEVWNYNLINDPPKKVIQLRRKIFASDNLILGTLAHEWGHLLHDHFPNFFEAYENEILKLFPSSNNLDTIEKRKEEIRADMWAGYLLAHYLKNNSTNNFTKSKLKLNFCQLESSEKLKTDFYKSTHIDYLHPEDRANVSWEYGFSL